MTLSMRRHPADKKGFHLHPTKGWRGSDGPTARKRGIRDRQAEKAAARETERANILAERAAAEEARKFLSTRWFS